MNFHLLNRVFLLKFAVGFAHMDRISKGWRKGQFATVRPSDLHFEPGIETSVGESGAHQGGADIARRDKPALGNNPALRMGMIHFDG